VRGTVSSAWSHSPGVLSLDVTIPVNSQARIVIPKEEEATELVLREGEQVVWEKGKYVPGVPGVTGASQERNGSLGLEVGSGRYSFKLTMR